jgi:hypothetical protein
MWYIFKKLSDPRLSSMLAVYAVGAIQNQMSFLKSCEAPGLAISHMDLTQNPFGIVFGAVKPLPCFTSLPRTGRAGHSSLEMPGSQEEPVPKGVACDPAQSSALQFQVSHL